MLGVLGEAEARVDDDTVGGDAARQNGLHACVQFVDDLGDDVVVDALHIAARQEAAPVHHDEGGAGRCDDRDHRGVGEAAADVVDQGGAGREGLFGDGSAHGVDGDGDALGGETADDGDDALEFLGLVDAGGAWASGLAADVDQVGALRDQGEAVLDGGGRVEPAAAVGEGVGGHVHDSHDRAAVPFRKAGHAPASALLAHMFSVGPGRAGVGRTVGCGRRWRGLRRRRRSCCGPDGSPGGGG